MFVASSSSHIKTPSKGWRMLAALAYATLAVLLLLQPELAMAQLEKATQTTQALKDWLWVIIPVIGLISAGIIGILYSFDVIRKETAYQWAVGIVFAGAIAGGIIKLVFNN
ncbi:TrbC/VirB2 family protein [Achromobacter mucicolens]|uniref:TrbC/VirB2 family protein n=1 Tax=Achromobacter mucicolens TaxID=1389922 RepID=UPI0022F39B6F|nr:TrbC/VirB2 family protein [Achromobacter mucicolens]WBX89182.1 TrbC/VirB2 family protein [Achromobacter mucicolens]